MIAGVVVAVATMPEMPLAVVTDTVDTVPEGVDQVLSPRQNVVDEADVPEFRFVTGRLPVTPVDRGRPVAEVSVRLDGVPPAPLNRTGAPVEPMFKARAVAIPVPGTIRWMSVPSEVIMSPAL